MYLPHPRNPLRRWFGDRAPQTTLGLLIFLTGVLGLLWFVTANLSHDQRSFAPPPVEGTILG